ncbi:uncharacterized protein [Physcomitrium patens]|nr:uncharacterized protein LOC112279511 isoform X3 [Physcomitrium patens]|eukprot:XP_024369792.1 uncharacterized protein LOC112279511 isoform X3 [Physcomitrella patens]
MSSKLEPAHFPSGDSDHEADDPLNSHEHFRRCRRGSSDTSDQVGKRKASIVLFSGPGKLAREASTSRVPMFNAQCQDPQSGGLRRLIKQSVRQVIVENKQTQTEADCFQVITKADRAQPTPTANLNTPNAVPKKSGLTGGTLEKPRSSRILRFDASKIKLEPQSPVLHRSTKMVDRDNLEEYRSMIPVTSEPQCLNPEPLQSVVPTSNLLLALPAFQTPVERFKQSKTEEMESKPLILALLPTQSGVEDSQPIERVRLKENPETQHAEPVRSYDSSSLELKDEHNVVPLNETTQVLETATLTNSMVKVEVELNFSSKAADNPTNVLSAKNGLPQGARRACGQSSTEIGRDTPHRGGRDVRNCSKTCEKSEAKVAEVKQHNRRPTFMKNEAIRKAGGGAKKNYGSAAMSNLKAKPVELSHLAVAEEQRVKSSGSSGSGVCGSDKGRKRMLISKDLLELDGHPPNGAAARKPDHRHDRYDISRGKERVPISLSALGAEDLPEEFFYTKSSVVFQSAHVGISMARIGEDDRCSGCVGNCLDKLTPCECARLTDGEFAYTVEGLLYPHFLKQELDRKRNLSFLSFCLPGTCPVERTGDEPCKGHTQRRFIKECWEKCGCKQLCGNRIVQRGITARLQVFWTGGKGWGVRALDYLPAGTFVCEYVGEILTNTEMWFRNNESHRSAKHHFSLNLDADWCSERYLKDEEALCLDGTCYGNVARFINHGCFDTNLLEVPVEIESPDHHYYHLAFFTSKDVAANEELIWDYGLDFNDKDHPLRAFECLCGSDFCRGKSLGGNSWHKS